MEEEFDNIKKTKKNRKPTTCLSKINSYDRCSFCGSNNLIEHGVEWCTVCKKEYQIFKSFGEFFFDRLCEKKHFVWNEKLKKNIHISTMENIIVLACSDCGAVKTGKCPNCNKNGGEFKKRVGWLRSAWRNNIGKLACTRCNFRN